MNTKELIISSSLLILVLGIIGFLISSNTSKNDIASEKEDSLKTEGLDIIKDVQQTTTSPQQPATTNQPAATNNNQTTVKKTAVPAPPGAVLAKNADYKLTIKTNLGMIYIDLYEDAAPRTVSSFVYLTRLGFYDGLIFHRVIKDFMIQGGDPLGNGTGGPAYTYEDEFNGRPLIKGSVAMANSGPNTNGSQFFIVTADETPWLNGKHTNFGEVTAGMDIVEQIEATAVDQANKPITPIIMERVIVLESR